MRTFEAQSFHRFIDYDSAAVFSDVEFRHCEFKGCSVSITHDPSLRSTIRNFSLIDCTENGCSIGPAIVEDTVIENLRTPGVFQIFGAAFSHVVLQGRFDDLMINNDVLPRSDVNPPYEYENVEAFREANAEYYQAVDWALDISKAEFKGLDLRGVPGQLVRRDPETQILLTRERVLEGDWRDLPFRDGLTPFTLDFMIKQGMSDLVLIAPKRHRKFPLYLEDLQLLREAGVAELD